MSAPTFSREVLDAVADGTLPVRPGDMLKFPYSRHVVLVVIAGKQESAKAPDGPAKSGQWIEYVVSDHGGSLEVEWLDWSGYVKYWTVIRG